MLYTIDNPTKRAVGFKLSEGMEVPAELAPRFKFARQKSKLAGTIRGSFFVIKGEYYDLPSSPWVNAWPGHRSTCRILQGTLGVPDGGRVVLLDGKVDSWWPSDSVPGATDRARPRSIPRRLGAGGCAVAGLTDAPPVCCRGWDPSRSPTALRARQRGNATRDHEERG